MYQTCTKVKISISLNFPKFSLGQVATSIPICRMLTRSLYKECNTFELRIILNVLIR